MSETNNIFNSTTGNSIYDGHEDSYETITWVEKAVLLLSLAVSVLSALSSLGIVVECFYDYKAKADTTVTRVLFWMHLASIPLLLSQATLNFAVPSEVTQVWLAMGTRASCTAVGFIKQWTGCAVVCWDISLSLVYLLTVHYNWPSFEIKKWEPWFHAIVWPYTTILGIVPIFYDSYNFTGISGCWLGSSPPDCIGEECVYGEHAGFFLLVTIATVFIQLIVGFYVMVRIYIHVRKLENRNSRWAGASMEMHGTYNSGSASALNYTPSSKALNNPPPPTGTGAQRTLRTLQQTLRRQSSTATLHVRSREVAIQGLLYVSTAFFTYGALLIVELADVIITNGEVPSTVFYVIEIPFAMHGILYWIFFVRKRETMRTKYGSWLKMILLGKWCCNGKLLCSSTKNSDKEEQDENRGSATANNTVTSLGPAAMTPPQQDNNDEEDDSSTWSGPENFELEHDAKETTRIKRDDNHDNRMDGALAAIPASNGVDDGAHIVSIDKSDSPPHDDDKSDSANGN